MSEDPKVETVVFGRSELDPAEAEKYKEQIRQAKQTGGVAALKGSTPLGHVPRQTNTPILTPQRGPSASPLTDEGGVQPRSPGSPVLRPETAQQLQDMAAAQAKQGTEVEKEIKKDVEEAKEDLFQMFDFDGKNEAERILNNKKRRKEIESRCEPMKLEDLIMRDEVQQEVPIIPDKFVAKFRSMTPYENLFVKRIMADEKITSDQYLLERYGLCQLACSLMSINGSALPSHLDENGLPTDDLFNKKMKMIMKKSAYIIADLGINFYWFDLRVRRLLNPDDLKNG